MSLALLKAAKWQTKFLSLKSKRKIASWNNNEFPIKCSGDYQDNLRAVALISRPLKTHF
jgi:hypothetical protein